jgi:ApaG protein
MTANNPIAIDVTTEYLPAQSAPEQQRYVFAYHICIHNHGEQAAKLVSRHWLINDGQKTVQEVRGEGVVGEQPTIAPGDSYQYSSGAVLSSPHGTMEGSYQMVTEDGHEFEAPIAMFSLIHPNHLH